MRTIAVFVTLVALALAGCSAAATGGDDAATADSGSAAEPAVAVAPATGDDAIVGSSGVVGVTAAEDTAVPGGITVTGAGQASGTPDVVRVTVGVRVVRQTVDEALAAANAATERVLSTLDAAGVPAEDRQTRDFSIIPEYGGERPDAAPRITGYAVSNLVEAKIREVDRVGSILTAVADAGGDDTVIQGVGFALEDDGAQVAAARRAAFADARARAEQYAELAGVALGGLIGITDVTASSPRAADTFRAEAATTDVPIEPGTQEVTVRVTVRWALDGG